MSKIKWDGDFAPSFTPMEMIEQGVFEGIYVAAIKGIPSKYKEHKNALKRGADPDPSINRYGVKSRKSLKYWQEKGWTTKDSPLGWFEWYIKYFEGRRLDEDRWQINRWRSFVARHSGQLLSNCRANDDKCRPRQRQGLLQWAWDPSKPFTDEQKRKNLKRLQRKLSIEIVDLSQESLRNWSRW